MTLAEFVRLRSSEAAWQEAPELPWGDPAFSARMLREHLSQAHDGATRRLEIVERHVSWIDAHVVGGTPSQILDLGCGPGLYTQRLASLGHACVGVDIAPASINYATANATPDGMARYILADFNSIQLAEQFDLVMMIHGQFNVLSPDAAQSLLIRASAMLSTGSHLLLEVHPLETVRRIGTRPRNWHALDRGLFSDEPHVRLDESRWIPHSSQAVNLHWIIDCQSGTAERFAVVTQGYTDDELEALLRRAGFDNVERYPSLAGSEGDDNYIVYLVRSASKS